MSHLHKSRPQGRKELSERNGELRVASAACETYRVVDMMHAATGGSGGTH